MPYPSRPSSQLNKKTAAATTIVSAPGGRYYTRNYSPEAVATQALSTTYSPGSFVSRGARPPQSGIYSQAELNAIKQTEGSRKDYSVSRNRVVPPPKEPTIPGNLPPENCDFNLPPHAWSLPVRPLEVLRTGGDGNLFVNNNSLGNSLHRERRGLIWHWDSGGLVSQTDAEGNTQTASQEQKTYDSKNTSKIGARSGANNYNWGFQFLWNPETIQTNIERNMDVTPSSADRFRSVAGAFPGQETYSFTITLDRVNDFACIKEWAKNPTKLPFEIDNYYKHGYGIDAADVRLKKLKDLAEYGTMADLEYLFKALNGDGAGSDPKDRTKKWTTLLKKPTANIGFLSPSLLAFRFGPDATKSLSFVGWIVSLNINHIMFTETMIPIRTTVSFSCSAFAGSTIA